MYKPEISKNHAALHDLIERWNKACDETYIVSGRDKFWMTHRAAEALAQWYETQFRKNRTFKYEERMRYWRMVAAKELDKTAGQSTNGVFHTHPAWLSRRDEYTMCLRRSPNLKERLKGFLTLTYGQQVFFGLTGGALLALSPVILLFIINPQ
ncbi:MAG: hypothetical protein HXO65_05260 [Rothia mucilaginosa]|jgi:hypothetical protein|uniref:Uncharacterized protein n=1 Tax=Rothia mucilaginosa TaxID=43675 RepID=A0A930Q861_9MICC|nr:hypothetical protein [Rothia mucilaginosa]